MSTQFVDHQLMATLEGLYESESEALLCNGQKEKNFHDQEGDNSNIEKTLKLLQDDPDEQLGIITGGADDLADQVGDIEFQGDDINELDVAVIDLPEEDDSEDGDDALDGVLGELQEDDFDDAKGDHGQSLNEEQKRNGAKVFN